MQANFAIAVFVAMVFFAICCALKWVGVETDLLLVLSMAGLGLSTGLYLVCGAVVPRWERGLWGPSKFGPLPPGPPRVRVEIGRLVFLGAGIWFTTGGVGVLVAGIRLFVLGADEPGLPPDVLRVILGALGLGLAVFLVGLRSDQRRFDAAREVEDAQQRADLHP